MSLRDWAASVKPVRKAAYALIDLLTVFLKGQANRIPFDKGQGPGGFDRRQAPK